MHYDALSVQFTHDRLVRSENASFHLVLSVFWPTDHYFEPNRVIVEP